MDINPVYVAYGLLAGLALSGIALIIFNRLNPKEAPVYVDQAPAVPSLDGNRVADLMAGAVDDIVENLGDRSVAFAMVIVYHDKAADNGLNWRTLKFCRTEPHAAEIYDGIGSIAESLETEWGMAMGPAKGNA